MKVNINIPLLSHAAEHAMTINSWYVDCLGSDFVFAHDGAYPHLTLLIGGIHDIHTIGLVEDCVSRVVEETNLFTILLAPCYSPAADSPYVFLRVVDHTPIMLLKELLIMATDGLLTIDPRGSENTVPHVTVSYIKERPAKMPYPESILPPASWVPTSIAIAKMSDHGACVEVLKEIPFSWAT